MKLSIAIDMGAKYNGVFIAKTDNDKIVDKKATTIVIEKNSINFSKKSRRENRHKVRNYKRRKLAKRLFWEIYNKNDFSKEQQELLQGLFNNRGYTYISIEDEFENISLATNEYLKTIRNDIFSDSETKEDFLKILDDFDTEEEVINFCNDITHILDTELKKNKKEIKKEFQENWNTIKNDIKNIKNLYLNVINEIKTGAKPRKTYLKEIKQEIEGYDFIENKNDLYKIVGNISNLQLRILRKFFNDDKDRYQKLKNYFLAFHYNDKSAKKELFKELNKYNSLEEFLKNADPTLTIPPPEDMNNRNTYKCNSILIKEDALNENLKSAVEILEAQEEFKDLKLNGLSCSQKLQRILDINSKIIEKKLHPREVFYYKEGNFEYYRNLLGKNYEEFKNFANKYYESEKLILDGIFKSNDILEICHKNTPYKNNIKHTLLKPLYSYDFSPKEARDFLEKIKNTYGLQTYLEKISKNAKMYQNSFYSVIKSCYEDEKCVADKEIKSIVKNLDKKLKEIQNILDELGINSNLKDLKLSNENLTKILNIFKQTYEILFKDIKGFSKTCKNCTIENGIRSDENNPIAKRLMSDVSKPIDGMLEMLLDRLAFEIVEEIENINDIDEIELILEQNKFEFEENLADIKGKKYKREDKDALNSNYCAYTGKKFDKGDWDHIIPQSKELINSKANLIYVSVEGNRKKSNKIYTLKDLSKKHLLDIFKTDNLDEIKKFISKNLPQKENFKNFDALTLKEQIALRYALFMDRDSDEFKKAYEIVKQDKLKIITNGTQKRLARLIQEKLQQKFNKDIKIFAKIIDNKLISATRKDLSINKKTGEINPILWKDEIQDSRSHAIDAMVAFYLANSTIKNLNSKNKETILDPIYDFKDIYLTDSLIKQITKRQTFINAKEISSYKLFQDTIYSENYYHITKENLKEKELETLIKYELIYYNNLNKKIFIKKLSELTTDKIYKIDVFKLSQLLHKLFKDKNEQALKELKFLDKLRYNTTRVEIENIFFNDKKTKLLEFDKIKNIPPYSQKTFKAIYEKLKNSDIFDTASEKTILNKEKLESVLKELFASKQKKSLPRKRGKKRHKFTLPILGQNAKYRIYRDGIYQVVGSENIATKNYIINGNIIPIPYFTKNTFPLKISDLLNCLLLNKNSKFIYELEIKKLDNEIKKYISSLKFIVSEAKRLTIIVTFIKEAFTDINFNEIKIFDGSKEEGKIFRDFIKNYIDNKELPLYKYIGSIRDGEKAKATLLNQTQDEITLKYKAAITKYKKEIILENLKNETHNN